ncbi:MAG: nickel pincer cofactor biosynthesis protein LarB [Cyanobacterium sp. T60_A2020_053]|nr:nickel pincer cofactor biosynthesis protein LarB [Cyanobacterium sp. T60_A2020_053]
MTNQPPLQKLLEAIAEGKISPQDGVEKIKNFSFETVGDFAKVDHHRQLRTGFPEVIWSEGKTPEQIIAIIQAMKNNGTDLIMATRLDANTAEIIATVIDDFRYYPLPRIGALGQSKLKYQGKISIITAGTADLPVAEESALTAELSGFQVERLWDVGVAGIHRLLNHRHLIQSADVLIVVAGMEGALPSVVAGMANCPVIAVPTSVGYGTNFGGVAPLLTMLNSCATGIGVVNIDNGFGGAMLAGQILRLANRFK